MRVSEAAQRVEEGKERESRQKEPFKIETSGGWTTEAESKAGWEGAKRMMGEDSGRMVSWSQRRECFRKKCPKLLDGLQ